MQLSRAIMQLSAGEPSDDLFKVCRVRHATRVWNSAETRNHLIAAHSRSNGNGAARSLLALRRLGLKYHGSNLVCDEVIQKNGKVLEWLLRKSYA